MEDKDHQLWIRAILFRVNEDKLVNDLVSPRLSHNGKEGMSMNRYHIGVFCPWEGEGCRMGRPVCFCKFQEVEMTSPAAPNIFSHL